MDSTQELATDGCNHVHVTTGVTSSLPYSVGYRQVTGSAPTLVVDFKLSLIVLF